MSRPRAGALVRGGTGAALVLATLFPLPATAQRTASPRPPAPAPPAGRGTSATIGRADSAFAAGDRAAARALYALVLQGDSTHSRAVFRLALLEPSASRAVTLLRRYVVLEPRDPWGAMAEGDALGRLRRWDEALAAYARAEAMAPAERDVALGRARLLERAGRASAAAAELQRWTARHGDDGEAWDLLGRMSLRAGRPRAASAAFARAHAAGTSGAAERLSLARALAAPAGEPVVGYQRDSDGNHTARFGVQGDVMIADGTRAGAGAQRLAIGDAADAVQGTELVARLSARPVPAVRLEVQGGATRFEAPRSGGVPWTAPHGEARLRWRAPLAGPSLEVRVQRAPLGYAPVLIASQVTRTEARATAEIPLGIVRLRGSARAGQLAALGEAGNGRTGTDAALVLPVGDRVQLSTQYRRLGFQRGSLAGYFAPRLAETAEGGVYLEGGGDGPVSIAADLGAGAQRVAEQGADVGRWTRALRAWAYASVALAPARAWYVELEAYDAPFAPEGITTAGNWRFLSLSTGVRWALW